MRKVFLTHAAINPVNISFQMPCRNSVLDISYPLTCFVSGIKSPTRCFNWLKFDKFSCCKIAIAYH